jgi:hypothetical protein
MGIVGLMGEYLKKTEVQSNATQCHHRNENATQRDQTSPKLHGLNYQLVWSGVNSPRSPEAATTREPMSFIGPELTSRDVRYPVAIGTKADVRRTSDFVRP